MTKPRQNSSIWCCARRRRNGKSRLANGARRKPSSPSCAKTGSSWHDGQPARHTRFLTAECAIELGAPGQHRLLRIAIAMVGLAGRGLAIEMLVELRIQNTLGKRLL